jgi:hypothetical protein
MLLRPVHLLQKDDVGRDNTNGVAQLGQDEPTIEVGEPLVGVDGHHLQGVDRTGGLGLLM